MVWSATKKIIILIFILISLTGLTQAAGTDADIQKAIDDCTTGKVTLKADTYILSNPVILKSNIILTAEEGTIIKLKDHAGWKKFRGMFEAIGCENITIYGFEVDGNEPNQNEECGACYYTIFLFDGSSDLVFHDLNLHDNTNDGIRVFNSESKDCDITVYGCTFERTYHNGVYLHKANYAKIHDNKFIPRTNAGICATDSNHLKIYNNVVDTGTPPTGGAGFEIQKTTSLPMDDIEVYNNKISNTNLPGIWLYGYNAYEKDSAKDVYIHDNTITGCGMGRGTDHYYGGGVVVQGFNNTILENNIIKDNYNEGVTLGNVYSNPPNYNYITVMKGNTITGTIASTYKGGKDLSVSSTYGYVSDGKIPEHDEEEDTTDDEEDNKDGDGEGEDDVKVIKPDEPEPIDNETVDDNPNNDYYAPIPGREFEYFMNVKAYTTIGINDTAILPEGMKESRGKAIGSIEYQHVGNETSTIIKMPKKQLNGVTEIIYEVDGVQTTHTLLIGERTSTGIVFAKTSMWNGGLEHTNDDIKLDGKIDPKLIHVTCVTPNDSFTPILEIHEYEFKPFLIHPGIFIIIGIVIFGVVIIRFILRHRA